MTADVEALKAEGKSSQEIREALQAKGALPPEFDAKSTEELEGEFAKLATSEGAASALKEMPSGGKFASASEIVALADKEGVTGTLNLAYNIADEDREEGWIKTHGLAQLTAMPSLPGTLKITVRAPPSPLHFTMLAGCAGHAA